MAVKIHAKWLPGGELEVIDFPQEVRLEPSHEYVCASGNDVVIRRMFDTRMAVRDVHRYNVKTGVVLKCPRDMHPSAKRDLPTVVLLLESPHKDEYGKRNGEYNPIAPAMGKTGRNLDDGLGYVLSQIPSGLVDGSKIIISNPIQFQASLHMIQSSLHVIPGEKMNEKVKKKVKTAVWDALWEQPCVQDCFKSRMRDYSPYIIINACTGGQKDNNGLNKKVTCFLKEKKICREIYEIDHPSGWSIPSLWRIYTGGR